MLYSYTERLALTGFLNALLNEWKGYEKNNNEILISSENTILVLPLLHDSLVQRFSFEWPAHIRNEGQDKVMGFQDVISFICNHSSIRENYSEDKIAQFKEQVFASESHMSDVVKYRKTPISIDGFIAAEQSLVGGHNLHPASKTHKGWDQQQAKQFSPDYADEFSLHWYFIKSELIAGESAVSEAEGLITPLNELLLQSYQDAGISKKIPNGFIPYPVHPFQAEVLAKHNDIQKYINDGLIVEIGSQGRAWRATSSTRALWQQGSRWMLKFSLAVKLTNSIRHLSTTELSRGVLFKQVSSELAGAEFNQRFPRFNVLQEPAWCGLKGIDGELILDSLFCWRENLYLTGKEPTVTLATMTQEDEEGSNPIARLVNELATTRNISIPVASSIWFEHFLENVIKPVTVARGDYGIVMLAHQQNLLVTLKDSLPVGGAFRDCQGTGYTDTALIRFPLLKKNKPALFLENEAVNPYFSYYLILNSLNSVIAALSIQLDEKESFSLIRMSQNLWRQLAQHSFYDTSFYHYLFQAENLTIKGNFFCFLDVENETELKDSSKIYVGTTNPYQLTTLESDRVTYKPILFDKADSQEKKTGLKLIFTKQKQQFSVESSREKWDFKWFVNNNGCYVLSQGEEGILSTQNNPFSLLIGTKMSPKQWLNVLEYCFEGLIELEGVEQDFVKSLSVSTSIWSQFTDWPIPSWVELEAGNVILTRSQFFQFSDIWTLPRTVLKDPQRVKAANGIDHPVRPEQPEGVFFQRYVYPLQRVITLRCADVLNDTAIFSHWHNKPNVARMWELAGDLSTHREYLTKQTNDKHSMAVIGYFDDVPFGYFEVYWAPEDRLGPYYDCQDYDRGVHMLVGNELFLGHKSFFNWSRAVMHAIFVDEQATLNIMGEPRADNLHVARITKNIGMKKLKEFDFPHKRSALMCCSRASFFNSFI
ncbi:GNAT family N-acetyltransferase [Psychromonas algicola]|uniref:GNAT family N-acetyltransferase n=1 Tax=Psychromonas algicola TaxID=2555642 RepID=UPI001068A792|nr:GNAT family N-acetyltransferase [Psychromonas sp. RZ5]TEW51785.1 GNAT family N-acetyltransferase [Psychromonas sp. RZ5]